MGIFQSLQGKPRVRNVAVERSLKTCRPDVSAYINGIPVAIEVQISALSMQTIIRRTAEYARRGIYVLWLPQWRPELDRPRYSPRLWEKWIHAAYFGRVYYWVKGLTVVCYHFHPYETGIPKKSRRPQFSNARGFRSKRYRVPIRGKTLNLATDFFPTKRQWWKGGKFTVPYARLYIHDVKKSASNSARQFR